MWRAYIACMSAETTTTDVLDGVDLSGKTALVTGASAGLGVETVRALRSVGCEVVGAVRDLDKARPLVGDDLIELDLSDLDSARAAGEQIAKRLPRIDLLINNAGVMATPLLRTRQGFELQLGTNHLGHFVLTTALLPQLVPGSRIVNLSSRGHGSSGMRWEDPHFRDESTYDKWVAYGQSKTANVLFSVELEKRLSDQGIHAYAVHPGVIRTELSRHLTRDDAKALSSKLTDVKTTYKNVEQGAATTVWAATAAELADTGGVYLEDCHIAGPVNADRSEGVNAWATDPSEASRLWEWSLEQTA
jgi:NAD(P)-dependent dehydrogenase (short-subunit alcohol dehydrogenase family)